MKASTRVHGNTLYEVQELAHIDLQAFFEDVPYQVTEAHAEAVKTVGGKAILWSADYTAESRP